MNPDPSSGSAAGEVTFSLRTGRRDGLITAADLDEDPIFTERFTLNETPELFTIDLSDKDSMEQFRELFELGYRSVVASFSMTEGSGQIFHPAPQLGSGFEITRQSGVVGQLLDERGGLIADRFLNARSA